MDSRWFAFWHGKTVPGEIHGGPVSRVNVIVAPYKSRLIAEEYGSYIKTTAAAAW